MDWLQQLARLPAKEIFALTVIGALITAAATIVSTVLKDYLFARSLERWKLRRDARQVYRKYRDPIVLAAAELLSRFHEALFRDPNFFSEDVLSLRPARFEFNDVSDPYFRRYKFASTIYRFCALLGWLELYRRDVTFLDSGRSRINRKLDAAIERFRGDVADGHLNDADDWLEWKDHLVFREELRAVGELMIAEGRVMGYAQFIELFEGGTSHRWLDTVTNVFLNFPSAERDFRVVRFLRATRHLLDLITLLDPRRRPSFSTVIEEQVPKLHAKYRVAVPL